MIAKYLLEGGLLTLYFPFYLSPKNSLYTISFDLHKTLQFSGSGAEGIPSPAPSLAPPNTPHSHEAVAPFCYTSQVFAL